MHSGDVDCLLSTFKFIRNGAWVNNSWQFDCIYHVSLDSRRGNVTQQQRMSNISKNAEQCQSLIVFTAITGLTAWKKYSSPLFIHVRYDLWWRIRTLSSILWHLDTLTLGMTSYVTHYISPRAALVILKSHPYDHITHICHILYHHAQEITLTCLGIYMWWGSTAMIHVTSYPIQ